jgi:hypothetical protein
MKQALTRQTRRAGIALFAAMTAVSTLGIAAAQAQEFAAASITLENAGEAAGALNCSFRETGLPPGGFVRYDCSSQYVGVLAGCIYKGKLVGNSRLYIYNNIHPEEVENLLVKNNGSVRASVITQIPEPGEANALLCTAPSEVTNLAIRWCNNNLTDLTNNIVGATVPELFAQLVSKVPGTVPDCAALANGPFTPPGE